MNIARIFLSLALLLALVGTGWAKLNYVRPLGTVNGSGVYDGSSYANAWAGLSTVVWGAGAGKVNPGDTLWICGTFRGEALVINGSGTDAAHPTIYRGDYPGDPGIIDGGAVVPGPWTQVQVSPPIWSAAFTTASSYLSCFVNQVSGQGKVATTYTNIVYAGQWYFASNTLYLGYGYDPATIPGAGVTFATAQNTITTNYKNNLEICYLTVRNCNTAVLLNGNNIDFHSNTVENSNYGVSIAGTTTGISISRSLFDNFENVSSAAIYCNATANNASNVTITNNKIMGGQNCGIYNTHDQTGWVIDNNLFAASRGTAFNNTTANCATLKNNIFWFNSPHDLDADILTAHSNNCFFDGENPNIVDFNGTLYDYSNLATFEATVVTGNPFPNILTVLDQPLHAATIAADGTIYGGVDTGAVVKVVKKSPGSSTWSDVGTVTWTTGCLMRACDFDSAGNLYVSVADTNAAKKGLWQFPAGGSDFTRVIDGSAWGAGSVVWGFDEAPNGTLFCNNYPNTSKVFRSLPSGSTPDGITWASVKDAVDTHIHRVVVDKTSGYVYCCEGDTGAGHYVSQDNGGTWGSLAALYQRSAGFFGGPGYLLMGPESLYTPNLNTTNGGTSFDIKHKAAFLGSTYAFGGDTASGRLLATATSAGGVDRPGALFYTIDAGETWKPFVAMRCSSVDGGYWNVTRKAVDGKVVVSLYGEDGAIKNAYLIDLNALAAWDGKLPPNSPCIAAGSAAVAPRTTLDFDGKPFWNNRGAPPIGAYRNPTGAGDH